MLVAAVALIVAGDEWVRALRRLRLDWRVRHWRVQAGEKLAILTCA